MATDRSTGPRLPLSQAGWMLSGILSAGMVAPAAATPANDPAIIAQGEYITRLADCGACHTRAGGQPYAKGQHGVGTYSTMPGFAATLSDLDISNIVNYLRSEWGNHAPMNATTALVNSLRRRATGQD